MIDVLPYVHQLPQEQVKQNAGVIFSRDECRGEQCCRTDHPVSSNCRWWESSLVTDEIMLSTKGNFGKHEEKLIWIPIRWYNFMWSVNEIEKNFPLLKDLETLVKALKHAELNCFDMVNKPQNMAAKLGYSSYSSFLRSFQEQH